MNCDQARECLSAGIDGESAVVSREHLAGHLGRCASCREWQELAHAMTRSVRLGSAVPSSTLPGRIVEAVARDARQRRNRRYWLAVSCAVAAAGLLQLLATVPLLVLTHTERPGSDASQILGVTEAIIGAAFFLGALAVLWKSRDRSTIEVVAMPKASREPARTETNEAVA